MDYSKKQKELDIAKWNDSQSKNYDTCGEYKYCKNCNKNSEYPCAYAYETYNTKTTKTTSYKTSTPKTCKKPSTRKTTTRKTTTRKTTAKASA